MSDRMVRAWVVAASVAGLLAASSGVALAGGVSSLGGQTTPNPDLSQASLGKQETFAAQQLGVQRITAPVQMTKDDPVPSRGFTGPSFMLADPANPRIIVAATAELRTRVCYLMRSVDAGHTWHFLVDVPAPADYPFCTSSTAGVPLVNLAWGRNHTLYYALDGYSNADGGDSGKADSSVILAKSTDLGNTWTRTIADNNRGKTGAAVTHDGPVTGLAVDTSGPQDVVYVGYSQEFPNAPMGSPQTGDNVMVSVSTNGGATFAPPVNLNTFAHLTQTISGTPYAIDMSGFGTPYLAAHNGVVIAVAGSNAALGVTIPGSPGMPMLVARSTDHGQNWTMSTLSGPVVTPTGAQTGKGWTPLGGPNGTFMAAYAATPDEQVYAAPVIALQKSTDLGKTWSSPVVLDDNDLSQLYTSFFPQLNVAPNGRVDVIWWDNRRSSGYSYDIEYTYSSDGGATWSHNVRITDQPNSFGLGISYNSDVRQPPGVASANQYAAFGWTDTRLSNTQTQAQDDFGAVAQFTPLPAANSHHFLLILAAIFGGLLVAGVILVVLLLIRRRPEGPSRPPEVEAREPVGVG